MNEFTCSQCNETKGYLHQSATIDEEPWCESCFAHAGATCYDHGTQYVNDGFKRCQECEAMSAIDEVVSYIDEDLRERAHTATMSFLPSDYLRALLSLDQDATIQAAKEATARTRRIIYSVLDSLP